MNTQGIKKRVVRTVMAAKFSGNGATPDDKRGKHEQHSKLDEVIINSMRAHKISIPRVASHYARATMSSVHKWWTYYSRDASKLLIIT